MEHVFSAAASPDGATVVYSSQLRQPCRLRLVGDWHAADDDARGEPYRQYSCRMAQWPHPLENLRAAIAGEGTPPPDQVLLLGDLLSFPTEKGVELASEILHSAPYPCAYTAGNHDGHYEGLPGPETDLRAEWTAKRLLPLYGGRDPLFYTFTVAGVKILMLDDSTYRILPEQLAALERELADSAPAVLGVHIPVHFPGLPGRVTSACGRPDWCAANDPYWEIERRERWPESGVDDTTKAFADLVWQAENLLGIVAGHTHRFAFHTYRGKFQLVVAAGRAHDLVLAPGEG